MAKRKAVDWEERWRLLREEICVELMSWVPDEIWMLIIDLVVPQKYICSTLTRVSRQLYRSVHQSEISFEMSLGLAKQYPNMKNLKIGVFDKIIKFPTLRNLRELTISDYDPYTPMELDISSLRSEDLPLLKTIKLQSSRWYSIDLHHSIRENIEKLSLWHIISIGPVMERFPSLNSLECRVMYNTESLLFPMNIKTLFVNRILTDSEYIKIGNFTGILHYRGVEFIVENGYLVVTTGEKKELVQFEKGELDNIWQ